MCGQFFRGPTIIVRHSDSDALTNAELSWALTDGTIGMENQSVAVAEALGLPFEIKRIQTGRPWRWLPMRLRPIRMSIVQRDDREQLSAPWPRFLISTGRHSVPIAQAIRRASMGQTFCIHIQDPKVPLDRFDLIAAPEHDGLKGENVVTTRGAPHRVTQEKLSTEADAARMEMQSLPRPWVTLLVGGTSKAFRLTPDQTKQICRQIAQTITTVGGSIFVTPSRRTGAENEQIIRQELSSLPGKIWDGEGPNPYFAYLGLADTILVTEDSVNMVTEAAGTGKPVYTIPIQGHSKRFQIFHENMRKSGITRPFEGVLDSWTYDPVNDRQKIADAAWKRLKEQEE